MYFNIYDWSKSGYRNAKDQIITETRVASKSITKFRKYIDGAYEESVEYNTNNEDEIGLPTGTGYGLVDGEDYFNYMCNNDITKVQFPIDPPSVLIKNSKYYMNYYRDIINTTSISTVTSNEDEGNKQTSIVTTTELSGRFDNFVGLTSQGKIAYEEGTLPPLELELSAYMKDVHTITEGTGVIFDNKGKGKSMPLGIWWRVSTPRIVTYEGVDETITYPMTSSERWGTLNTTPKKFNLVPSLDLKKFLAQYQSSKESPLGILPITSVDGDFAKDKYTTAEVKSIINDVIAWVNTLSECEVRFNHEGAYKRDISGEEDPSRFAHYRDQDSIVIHTEDKTYYCTKYTAHEKLRGEVYYGSQVVVNYSVTSLGTTTTLDSYTYNDIELSTTKSEYLKSTNREHIMFANKNSTEINSMLENLGYEDTEDKELMYNIGAVLGQICRTLPSIIDHSYRIGFTKESLLTALSNMKTMADKLDDEFDSEIEDIVKESKIGALLEQTGDIVDVLNTAGVEKLDYMYMSYRASTMDSINNFNDSDTMADVNQIHDLLTTRGIWKYITVYVKRDSFGDYEVRAYLPNWNRLQYGSNRIATKVMSAMVTIDNHRHIKKKSWWVKVRMAVVILVIVVLTCPTTGCTATPAAIAAVVAASANVIAASTGSERWAEFAKVAGYVSMAVGIAQTAANEGIGAYLKTNGWQTALSAIEQEQAHRHRSILRDIEAESKALNELIDDTNELITIQEQKNKVMEYITSGHIDDRYSYAYGVDYNV